MRHSIHRWFLIFSLLAFLPVWVAGCAGEGTPLIAIEINPLCVVLQPGETTNPGFQATIFKDGIEVGVDNSAVTWTVFGGDVNGVITQDGVYSAPDTVPPPTAQVKINATSKEDIQKMGEASVILSVTPTPDPDPCAAPPFS